MNMYGISMVEGLSGPLPCIHNYTFFPNVAEGLSRLLPTQWTISYGRDLYMYIYMKTIYMVEGLSGLLPCI